MSWDPDDLFNKAVVFLERAYAVPKDDAQFPLWSAMALELFGRAAVATVSPALLADPQQGESVLYAFGLATSGKSVAAKTVFERCQKVVPTFTKEHFDTCMEMMGLRNAEVHTGEAVFADGSTSWLRRYLAALQQLLVPFEKGLSDVIGDSNEVELAEQLLASERDRVEGEVKKKISYCKGHFFDVRSEPDRVSAKAAAEAIEARPPDKKVDCPACGARGLVRAAAKFTKGPVVKEDVVHIEAVCLPSAFMCASCDLELAGYDEMDAAGLGDVFVLDVVEDAENFYGERYIESLAYDDYGND